MNQGLPQDADAAANGRERWHKEPLAPGRGSVSCTKAPFATWKEHLNRTLCHGSSRRIELYPCISSTQNTAKDLITALGLEADGAVVVADQQTHGRGRLGRSWSAPPGACVLLSRVSVRPTNALHVEAMSLACAVAVAEALESVAQAPHLDVGIKWPNDLLVNSAKIAGLLLETMKVDALHSAVIVGVGINVTFSAEHLPAELRTENLGHGRAVTSLTMLGYDIDRLQVLTAVLQQLDKQLQSSHTDNAAPPFHHLLAGYRRRNMLLGQTITVRCDGRDYHGEVIDMDPLEGLLLRTDPDNVVHLPAATSTIVRA